eukprot:s1614_g10.t1
MKGAASKLWRNNVKEGFLKTGLVLDSQGEQRERRSRKSFEPAFLPCDARRTDASLKVRQGSYANFRRAWLCLRGSNSAGEGVDQVQPGLLSVTRRTQTSSKREVRKVPALEHADAANCVLGNAADCADLAKFGGCVKEANCCESSDASSEISSMTSWRKCLNELYAAADLAGLSCEPSPCVS